MPDGNSRQTSGLSDTPVLPGVSTSPLSPHSASEAEESFSVHSPMLLNVPDVVELNSEPRLRVFGCSPKDKSQWAELDSLIAKELRYSFDFGLGRLNVDEVLIQFTKFVRSFFSSFPPSSPPRKHRPPPSPVSRSVRSRLREIRRLWKHRDPSDVDLEASLKRERNLLRREIRKSLKRASQAKEDSLLHSNVKAFRENPYLFSKGLFQTRLNCKPTFSKEVVDSFFQEVYSDEDRSFVYDDHPDFPIPPTPSFLFSCEPPSFSELQDVLRHCRNSSCPGPNGISYKIYKFLPSLQTFLHKLFNKVWTQAYIPQAWRVAAMKLLPKTEDVTHPSKMRNIALSNVEGKIFFSILARRLQKHMLNNSFFDGQNQKGFISQIAGCVEHTSILQAVINDARSNKKALCISWLDFANAFGGVRHSLIQYALKRYSVPKHVRTIILSYYDRLFARVDCGSFTSNVFHYGIGVFQGCTASPILFNIVLQTLLDVLCRETQLSYSFTLTKPDKSAVVSTLVPTFADDMALVTNSCEGNQFLLNKFHQWLRWSKTMRLKVPKCLSLAFGLIGPSFNIWGVFNPNLVVGDQHIPVMSPEGFKYLGKYFDPSLSEELMKSKVQRQLLDWMTTVHKSPLLGVMRCWIYNNIILAKLSWIFTVYNFSLSFVKEKLHTIVLPFLKLWCGIPKGGNTAILFCGPPNCLGLNLHPVYTLYKACQVVRRGILRRSRDPIARFIFEVELEKQLTWLGPRFAAAREVLSVEAYGTDTQVFSSHHGLGFDSHNRFAKSKTSALKYFKCMDNDHILAHADALVMQGKIRALDNSMKHDWNWNRLIYGLSEGLFKFKINSSNLSLPTLDNIKRWTNEHIQKNCPVCQSPSPTLKHVLTGCTVSLFQGRYTWRHNKVLYIIYSAVQSYIDTLSSSSKEQPYITFVKHGHSKTDTLPRRKLSGILGNFADWHVLCDGVTSVYSIPQNIAVTTMRPDMFIYSESTRKCVLIELTVPFEDRVFISAERKSAKYKNLQCEIISNGYDCHLFTVEVGCRGNYSESLQRCLVEIGMSKRHANRVCSAAKNMALTCSYYLYLKRSSPSWSLN